jgi:WD40 repeat protein
LFKYESDNVHPVALIVDPQGQLLIGLNSGFVLFVDPQTGQATRDRWRLDLMPASIGMCMLRTMLADFSSDAPTLYTGCEDGTIQSYSLSDGTLKGQFQGHQQAVLSLALHPSRNWLLSSSLDQSTRQWEVQSFSLVRSFLGHGAEVNSLDFSSDGELLLTGSFDGSTRLWDSFGGLAVTQYTDDDPFSPSEALVWLQIAPDNSLISALSDRSTFLQWRTDTAEELSFLELPGDVVLSDRNGALGLVDVAGTFEIWQLDQPAFRTTLQDTDIETSGAFYINTGYDDAYPRLIAAFSPDVSKLIAATTDGVLNLWNVADGTLMATFDPLPDDAYATALAFSSDGSQLITGDDTGSVYIWNVADGKIAQELGWFNDEVSSVALSPDGRYAIAASLDRSIALFYLTAENVVNLVGHTGPVRSVAFSPDSSLVLSGGEDGAMRLWEVATGLELARYDDLPGAVASVAFNSDGTQALAGTTSNQVFMWYTFNRDQLIEWVRNNRYVPELPCSELTGYQIFDVPCTPDSEE